VKRVFVIGTCDTKGEELQYACQCVRRTGAAALLVDISTMPSTAAADVKAETVASYHPKGRDAVLGLSDRGEAVTAMAVALVRYMLAQKDVGAVLGLGGSGNTAIVTGAMQALPVGLPKLMVSTLASGNVASFVGPTDITMMYPVVDIAGLNSVSRRVIANAAHAIAGMALNEPPYAAKAGRAIGFTMFGVTTPCITALRKHFEPRNECFVFHATGTGGQSFEKLAESGFLDAAFDMTTTEVADHLFGGVLPCTADRFGAFIRRHIPYVGSVGATDMVNFGARDTVPENFKDRLFHIHNPHVTLMRTNAEENAAIGRFIVERLNRMNGPVRFLLPLKGVSALDAAGQPFHDPAAKSALFDAIRKGWQAAPNRRLVELDMHINEPGFASAAIAAYNEIAR
jgi:uncharacterized protein (UPF0261 family)